MFTVSKYKVGTNAQKWLTSYGEKYSPEEVISEEGNQGFWNFVGAVSKRPCMPNTVPYCQEIGKVKVVLPSAYDAAR